MHDLVLIASIAVTLGTMSIGIKLWGVGGGFAGFFLSVFLTGVVTANFGIELGDRGCERYSSIANDC